MKRLICFTSCFFCGEWYSVNYHMLLLLRAVHAAGGYEVIVYSYEENPTLTEREVLQNAGSADLEGKIMFQRMDTMSPVFWTDHMPKADVILCQHYSFVDILDAVRRCQPQVRIVSWIHSIVLEEMLSGSIFDKNDAYPLIRQQNVQVALSDFCIFDSWYDYGLGKLDFSDMRQACVIYPLTEITAFQGEKGWGDTDCILKPEILFVGRWDFRKGLDSLIPCSFRMFMEYRVKTVLLTDGEGEHVFSSDATRYQYRSLLRSGGLTFEKWKLDKKEYAGFLMKKRRIAVFPSYYDPFNMAAYDCAALGIPIVVSNRCGVQEILTDGKGLAVCNPYDMETLYGQICGMCSKEFLQQPAEYRISYEFSKFNDDVSKLFYETIWK